MRFWRSASKGIEDATKTNRPRSVPLSTDLADTLRGHPRTDDLVFALRPATPVRPDNLYWSLQKLCELACVRHISFKDLRHTFATQLTQNGVPLGVVQQLLGHTTVHMTTRYAHPTDIAVRWAITTLITNRRELDWSPDGHQAQIEAGTPQATAA